MHFESDLSFELGTAEQGPPLEGFMPWEVVHAQRLDRVKGRRALEEGLLDRDSVLALPEGFVIVWDLSGYTEAMKRLGSREQVWLSREIISQAVQMAVDHGMIMLQPVAGDQAVYFLPSGQEAELPAIQEGLRRLRIPKTRDSLEIFPVKAAIVPVQARAVFVGSFLDKATPQGQMGYGALMGPGYVRASSTLDSSPKDAITLHTEVVRARRNVRQFDEFRWGETVNASESLPLRALTSPQVPSDPHYYGVLRAEGRVGLNDPMHSAVLAQTLFEHCSGVSGLTTLKQDAGVLHVAVPSTKNDSVEADFGLFVAAMNAALRREGLEIRIRACLAHVPHPLAVAWGPHYRDAVDSPIAVVHSLMGKRQVA